ncbi:hypothetical protein CAAN1_05S05578 [[Candida] anglica]|uniref:Uncharacterized protein n=1 Tax=[Candida] anglica TaxID=148631 RepID=A0ABP0ED69_9ASCO
MLRTGSVKMHHPIGCTFLHLCEHFTIRAYDCSGYSYERDNLSVFSVLFFSVNHCFLKTAIKEKRTEKNTKFSVKFSFHGYVADFVYEKSQFRICKRRECHLVIIISVSNLFSCL